MNEHLVPHRPHPRLSGAASIALPVAITAATPAACSSMWGGRMQYLVQMRLADSGRSPTREEGRLFIERSILPTLELCERLLTEKKILAGGPITGTVGLALIVDVGSVQDLDDLIAGMPVWPRMETEVTPLTTFEGRAATLRPRLEQLKS